MQGNIIDTVMLYITFELSISQSLLCMENGLQHNYSLSCLRAITHIGRNKSNIKYLESTKTLHTGNMGLCYTACQQEKTYFLSIFSKT